MLTMRRIGWDGDGMGMGWDEDDVGDKDLDTTELMEEGPGVRAFRVFLFEDLRAGGRERRDFSLHPDAFCEDQELLHAQQVLLRVRG